MNAVAEATAEAVNPENAKGKPKRGEIEEVKMTDGRTVAFAGKRKMLKSSVFEGGRWTKTVFDFRDGRTLTYDAPSDTLMTVIDGDEVLLKDKEAAHGSEQKIGDETAGKSDSISDMYDAVEECIERLGKGEWYTEGTGAGAFGMGTLLKALAEFTGKTTDALRPWLKARTADERKALRATPKLRTIIQRIEDEEAAKAAHVDADSLLGQLQIA